MGQQASMCTTSQTSAKQCPWGIFLPSQATPITAVISSLCPEVLAEGRGQGDSL